MRVNSNMLMGLVLCMVLFGGVAFLTRINKGQHVWTPNDIYSSIGGSSYSIANVSTSTASNSGVTLSLRSSRPLLSSARRSTSSVVSYAPAQFLPVANTQYPIGGTPSYSSKGTSALYTTSGATVKSFGGGNAVGSSSFGSTARNASASNDMIASSPNIFTPLSLAAVKLNADEVHVDPVVVSSVVSVNKQTSVPYIYNGIGYTTLNYGVSISSATYGVKDRKNAPGMGGLLDDWVQDLIGNGDYWSYNIDGIDYFDYEKLRELYNAAIANGDLPEGVTWDEFLSWFGDQSGRYAFPIPSGVWFMCLLALGYGLYIAYRRKQKVVNS